MKINVFFGAFALLIGSTCSAETVAPVDYMIAGEINDSWNYQKLDNTLFTWTLAEVAIGPNAGRFERGNIDSGIVYDQAANNLTLYELDKNPLEPPLAIGVTQLEQILTYDDGEPGPTMYVFTKIPAVTVQAGTFSDVLAWVFLDENFAANSANIALGLDALPAVTDVSLFALGIGEIGYLGIDALTGDSDGLGHELASTSVVPISEVTINFTGTLGFIETDSGSSTYSGLPIGEVFAGSFTYGYRDSDASSIDIESPISADYFFTGTPYGGTITGGATTTTGVNSTVGLGDDDGMGDDAVFLNNLYGPGSTTAGTIADTWSADSSNGTQTLGLIAYSLDTSLFAGLAFQPLPPTLGDADFALFYIEEDDSLGNTIYLASGQLTSMLAVPVPVDLDGDLVRNHKDNCIYETNAQQVDADNDGIGNRCDADLNNDCAVNFLDLVQMKAVFFTCGDLPADLDSSGCVNFADLGIMKSLIFLPPGPSGLPNICDGR